MYEVFLSELKCLLGDISRTRFLLAVSGGIDSMVMLDLFIKANLDISVAHINYRLRGEESEKEMKFVEAYCSLNQIPFYKKIVTHNEAREMQTGNLQNEARKIRYAYFRKLLTSEGHDYVCTAHHKQDSLEGFFINALRGSGMKGLAKIHNTNRTLRPLGQIRKDDIESYAKKNMIKFCVDSSNLKSDYQRNFLRNDIFPELDKKFPNWKIRLAKTQDRIHEDNLILNGVMEDFMENKAIKKQSLVIYNWNEFSKNDKLIFSRVLRLFYGFHDDQIDKIYSSKTGAIFYSTHFEGLVDRDSFVIREKRDYSHQTYYLEDVESEIHIPEIDEHISLTKEEYDQLDHTRLIFPLEIRVWSPGDRFHPIRLKGRSQKVKDYLTNKKVSRFEKQMTFAIFSQGQICHLIGHESDWRFAKKKE